MAKKRKTRQQKVIAQLKRQLAAHAQKETVKSKKEPARQGAILTEPKTSLIQKPTSENTDKTILFTDSSLIKKDLLKTIGLALVIISLEVVLYLKLR